MSRGATLVLVHIFHENREITNYQSQSLLPTKMLYKYNNYSFQIEEFSVNFFMSRGAMLCLVHSQKSQTYDVYIINTAKQHILTESYQNLFFQRFISTLQMQNFLIQFGDIAAMVFLFDRSRSTICRQRSNRTLSNRAICNQLSFGNFLCALQKCNLFALGFRFLFAMFNITLNSAKMIGQKKIIEIPK